MVSSVRSSGPSAKRLAVSLNRLLAPTDSATDVSCFTGTSQCALLMSAFGGKADACPTMIVSGTRPWRTRLCFPGCRVANSLGAGRHTSAILHQLVSHSSRYGLENRSERAHVLDRHRDRPISAILHQVVSHSSRCGLGNGSERARVLDPHRDANPHCRQWHRSDGHCTGGGLVILSRIPRSDWQQSNRGEPSDHGQR